MAAIKKSVLLIAAAFLFLTAQAQGKKVTLSSLEWEPYIGKDIPHHGVAAEIAAEAFRRSGYDLEIRFYPWARALYTAKEGSVDGLFPEYYDTSRLKDFEYSEPFKGGPVGFLARRDSNIVFHSLKDLAPYSIGIVRGYINTAEFDHADYLRKEAVTSDEANITKLIRKRVDLIFIDKLVAHYILSKLHPDHKNEVIFLHPALETKELYIAFSKKAPGYKEKMAAYNAGLKKMEKDGTLKVMMKKAGILN